jgi:His/Glu/Gln/Arg/opine family amino acid ABC transporter permease subunit
LSFDADIFFSQLFSIDYLNGAILSVGVAFFSLILATIIGFFVAIARTSRAGAVRAPASVYVWFFRAIPALLVLLIMWNAMPQVFPALRENWYTPFIAAVIGLALVESAFMAEIIRYVEYYTVAIIYYLVIVSLVTWIQTLIERKFNWSSALPVKKNLAFWKASQNRSLI